MRGKAGVVLVALAGALACAGPSGAAGDDVSISVARTHIETSLGRKLGFQTTVVNDGSAQTAPLVAHMTVFSLRAGTYVDPEDWSSQRTKYLAPIPAGGSQTLSWDLQAVNDGRFAVSVEVVPRTGIGTPATGPAVRLDVAQRETLDSAGILPLALGVPALVAFFAFGVQVVRRRR